MIQSPATSRSSLDHVIGAGADGGWNLDADRFRGLEVEHELELGGQNDRQVGRLIALENPPGIDATLAKGIRNVVAVTDQAAIRGELAKRVDRGQRMARRQC